jgi:hypothetical protein
MAEHQIEPPAKPPLRPHRLIPANAVPAEGLPIAAVEQEVEGWLAEPAEASLPGLAAGGRRLAEQAWLFMEKAAPTLDALPAMLKAANAPEMALQTLELLGSMLLALPDQMSAGLESSVARVDWLFSRLLNAPGHPGLIEQVIEALAALGTSSAADEPPADPGPATEILRGLHRDLVTLQQRWDELIEEMFPSAVTLPISTPLASGRQAAPAGPAADAPGSIPAPKAPTPLPAGLVIAQPAADGPPPRAFRFAAVGRQQQRLAMLLALLLLVLAGTGVFLVQIKGTATNSAGAALSVNQNTPVAARPTQPTRAQPTPTRPVPTPTPTPRPPTPTPRPPTPTPTPTSTPTPGSPICPSGAAFCVSAVQLSVPCAGQGSATLQLTSAATGKNSWQTLFLPGSGGALVTISPSHGSLKQGQTVTLTVQASNQGKKSTGTIMIFGPFGTKPINVATTICG